MCFDAHPPPLRIAQTDKSDGCVDWTDGQTDGQRQMARTARRARADGSTNGRTDGQMDTDGEEGGWAGRRMQRQGTCAYTQVTPIPFSRGPRSPPPAPQLEIILVINNSWEALDGCKSIQRGVGTVCHPANTSLKTFQISENGVHASLT